jgi:ArsR family transcriptional regulator, virulence genes transcriptional regulator
MNMNATSMTSAADAAGGLLKSLAHPTRLLILCRLMESECSVGELAAFLGIRDSTASQHLALLRRDGLVQARREAQTIRYAIASTPARAVLETLALHYCPPREN